MLNKNRRRAVFLDRDGTILNERGYLKDPRKMKFYRTVFPGLKILQKLGFQLVVVSNQSGIARGYFSLKKFEAITRAFQSRLKRRGIQIKRVYFCPHLPKAGCACRKPKPGMIRRAAKGLGIDPRISYVIGDQDRDLLLAKAVKARGILVLTGQGRNFTPAAKRLKFKVTQNLLTAGRWIVGQEH